MKKHLLRFVYIVILSTNLLACNSQIDENQNTIPEAESDNLINDTTEIQITEEIINIIDQSPRTIKGDFEEYFESVDGSAVFWNPSENTYTLYNEEDCKTEVSPCSTFKIISTLIGLHNRVITSTDSQVGYDGTKYPLENWNDDLSLEEAFKNSCVWYFRKVIESVGKDKVKEELEQIGYGNSDVSEWEGSNCNPLPDMNGFWLESSLKISPLEQVNVLQNIIENKTIYTEDEISILESIMLVETKDNYKVYGKTGTGTNKNAWFVGFIENQKSNTYFAIYLNDNNAENVTGTLAKEIAMEIIEQFNN